MCSFSPGILRLVQKLVSTTENKKQSKTFSLLSINQTIEIDISNFHRANSKFRENNSELSPLSIFPKPQDTQVQNIHKHAQGKCTDVATLSITFSPEATPTESFITHHPRDGLLTVSRVSPLRQLLNQLSCPQSNPG